METRIIFTVKDNQGNLRDVKYKAFIEKSHHPINSLQDQQDKSTLLGFVGEPDIKTKEIYFQLNNESSNNILVACENESFSFRIMVSILITLYKQTPVSKFYILNNFEKKSDHSNYINEIGKMLDLKILQNENNLNEILLEIKSDIESRIKEKQFNEKKIFVSIFSYNHAFEFRRADYGDSKLGEILKYILKEGTNVGVFVMLQVDSLQSLQKNTNDLDEFNLRFIGQVNWRSSAGFLDGRNAYLGSKDAFEIEQNRAIFYDCKKNKLTKFIPYELPNLSWLEQLLRNNSPLS